MDHDEHGPLDNSDVPVDEVEAATLAEAIGQSSPTGARKVRDHVAEHGEVLPTILLAALGEWFVAAYTSPTPEPGELQASSAAINAVSRCFEVGTEAMQEIVATGLLEAMPYANEDGRAIVDELPRPLREELRAMEDASPPR